MFQLISEVERIFDKRIQEETQKAILRALIDMGECMAFEDHGSALNDFKDAIPCDADAAVALIAPEYEQIVLCARCYLRLQERGEIC